MRTHLLRGKCLEINSAPILKEPVPEMPWTVTLRPSFTTGELSPNASFAASLQKSPSPPIGAYLSSRVKRNGKAQLIKLTECNSLFVQSLFHNAQFSFKDGGKYKGLTTVVSVCPNAQIHLDRAGVLLESLCDTQDGVWGTHCYICPV